MLYMICFYLFFLIFSINLFFYFFIDLACPHSNASPLPVVAFMKQIQEINYTDNIDYFLPAFVDRVMETVLPSLLSKNRYVLQMGCNVLLQSQTDSTMSNSFELLMKRLFDITHDDPDWKKLAEKALTEYLNPEVGQVQPLEQETVEAQFEAFLTRSQSDFGKVLSVEQNLVEKMQVMSQDRPLLVYSDTSGALGLYFVS